MTDQTLQVIYWKTLNPHNYQWVSVNDWEPDLALRLARILASGNKVMRAEVIHTHFDQDGQPHDERTEVHANGKENHRTRNYVTTNKGCITTDQYQPWKDEA